MLVFATNDLGRFAALEPAFFPARYGEERISGVLSGIDSIWARRVSAITSGLPVTREQPGTIAGTPADHFSYADFSLLIR